MHKAHLQIDILSYWHAGTGKGSGTDLDALTEKDHSGLPFVSGKHLKGLLRQACLCAENWDWFKDYTLPEGGPANSFTELLFGSQSQQLQRDTTFPGMVVVGNGVMSNNEHSFLCDANNRYLIPGLFQKLFSTAINEDGSAKKATLRGIEVAVPMCLTCSITIEVTSLDTSLRAQQAAFNKQLALQLIERVLPLIDHLGAWRNRGLGEVKVTLAEGVGA